MNEEIKKLDFIRQIVADDVAAKKHDGIVTRFPQVVLDGERVVASGVITGLREDRGQPLSDCDIWLQHDRRGVLLEGTATVCLSPLAG